MGLLMEEDVPLIWRGPMLHSVIQQFVQQVDWGELDYLLIDLPPGTGDVQLSITQTVPLTGAIVVSTPQNVALQDARKAVMMFRQGFGRLMRRQDDRGAVVIFDPRIYKKQYGRLFLESIPECATAENLDDLQRFFEE